MRRLLLLLFHLVIVGDLCVAQGIESHAISPEPYTRLLRAKGETPEPERLAAMIAEFQRQQSPEPVVVRHIHDERAIWRSRSPEQLAQERRADDALLHAVRSVNVGPLSASARLDRLVLEHAASAMAAGVFRNDDIWPTFHRVRPPFGALPAQPKTTGDYENLLAWMRGVPHFLDETRTRLRLAMKAGVIANRDHVLSAMEELEAATPASPDESPYLKPFEVMPPEVGEAAAQLRAQAASIYRTRIVPAYAAHRQFIRDIYLPRARPHGGLAGIPGGRQRYAAMILLHSGSDESAKVIHASARREVERLLGELTTLARRAGFVGSPDAYLRHLRTMPACGPLDDQAVQERFNALMADVQRALPRLFVSVPKTRIELVTGSDVPPAAAGAQARAGSLREGRAGQVRLAPVSNACSLPNVLLHEALPGHLLQYHTLAEFGQVSPFRRAFGSLSYSEGWAHYATGLSEELGLRLEPSMRAERVGGEIFMALRALVDTGIHWYGWTPERAAQTIRELAPWVPEQRVLSEVKVAVQFPARPMTYFVGSQAFSALRVKEERRGGVGFDVRAFHDRLLKMGPIPAGLLPAAVEIAPAAAR